MKVTKGQVKKTAVEMVKTSGLINLSRRGLCDAAGIPDGSFPHVMGCTFTEFVGQLRDEGIEDGGGVVSKKRTSPALRKDHILDKAVELSEDVGYTKITRDMVAERAGISMGLVSRYFGTMVQLRKSVMRRAVKKGIAAIVAQGIANNDERAKSAPSELKSEALAILAN